MNTTQANNLHHPAGRLLVQTGGQSFTTVDGTIDYERTDCGPVITATAEVIAPGDLTLLAQQEIVLLPGFSVDTGAVFTADIRPACDTVLTYQYFLTDHLGNVRVTFADADEDGTAELLQEHHYYPFGMEMTGGWDQVNGVGSKQRLRYNGKEYVEEIGLLDYGARWYDAAIGRWGAVDPLAEQFVAHSPYHYAYNNPILFVDPDGKSAFSPIFGTDGKLLGTDSEGFKGDIVIMDERDYNRLTDNGNAPLDHSTTKSILNADGPRMASTLDEYIASSFDVDNPKDNQGPTEFVEDVLTNLIDAAHAEGLIETSSADLTGGKINLDMDVDYANDAAANSTRSGGLSEVSALLKSVSLEQYGNKEKNGSTAQLWYLGNSGDAINILGVHEPLHRKYPSRGNGPRGHGGMNREILDNPRYKPVLSIATEAYLSKVKSWANGN